MAFLDDLAFGLSNPTCTVPINKASIATQLSAGFSSLWRATGIPAQGAIPTTAAIPTKATSGAMFNYANPASGSARYLAQASIAMSVAGATLYFVDRLAHMGGLNATLTTAQTVGIDVNSLKGTRAATDLHDVTWWLEIYSDIGTTATTGTIVYVSDTDASSQNITGFAIGGASPANQDSRIFPITPVAGHPIRSITSFQQVATTGTAGNYGFTAVRNLGSVTCDLANKSITADWASLPLAQLADDACLTMLMLCLTTSTGTVIGSVSVPEVVIPT